MKIALVQLDYHIGNFEENTRKIVEKIGEAKSMGADLAVFAELAICGYPPRDFLEFSHFIELCYDSIEKIAKNCKGIAAIVGSPSRNPDPKGKRLHNSAFFLKDGKIEKIIHKTLLPTYDVFDEYRYFQPNTVFECIELKGKKIALTICEDLWNVVDDNPLYTQNPMDFLIKEKPDLAVNIAASPFSYRHDARRTEILHKNASLYNVPFYYVNHTGAQTELIFDGASGVVIPDGRQYKMALFKEDLQVFEDDEIKSGKGAKNYLEDNKYGRIYLALIEGIHDYFDKLGFKKAVLGMSGGIDSAVVYALTVKALGKDCVLPVLMPSPFSSKGSVKDSRLMIRKLGTKHYKIPIEEVMKAYTGVLKPVFRGRKPDVTEENLQSRIRGAILMAVCNKFNCILLNTTNKSEMAVGYGTQYGDLTGALSVLGDVYKTEVYELAEHINRTENGIIPQSIITKNPSAELKPGQKDTDSLPPYSTLDPILFQYIENRQGPREIISMGYSPELVYRILKMVNQNEFKRYQAPPVLRVSDKGFGLGRRLPIVAKYLS
jgi:NAD+ synthase (glutamine-hydrolysing)